MTIPGTTASLTIALGTLVAWTWAKQWPKSHARFMYAFASGGIAGEGIGYVILSILQIAKVGGGRYGTIIGCTQGVC